MEWKILAVALAVSGCQTERAPTDTEPAAQKAAAVPVVAPTQVAADKLMEDITLKVATDAVTQYEIAEKSGDKMAVCVQAMGVSAAWLQAKNEEEYLKWKKIEKRDCAAAGLPQ